jgi:hypothetical protein
MAGRSSQARWISVLSPPGTTPAPARTQTHCAPCEKHNGVSGSFRCVWFGPRGACPRELLPDPRIGHPGCCFDVDHSDPAIRVRQQQARNMTPFPVPSASVGRPRYQAADQACDKLIETTAGGAASSR